MSDKHLPSDELLQLVFGELDNTREAAVRKTVAADAELSATVRGLDTAVMAVRAENVGLVGDEFNDRLRERLMEVFATQASASRPAVTTKSFVNWRWIMRHPVSRFAAVAILAIAAVAVAFGSTASARLQPWPTSSSRSWMRRA